MTPAQLNPEPKRDNVAYRVTRERIAQGREAYHAAAVAYFEERRHRLPVATTTETAHGADPRLDAIRSRGQPLPDAPPPEPC